MRSDIRRLRAIGKKELITLTSYRVDMMMQVLNLWYFAIAFYFIGEFVGDPESIQEFEGGYFEFVLIGSIVTSFAITGMQSFGGQIREEQNKGTLQAILATPTPMWTILTASYIVPSIFVIVETTVLVVVGLGIFGAGIPLVGLLKAIPLLVLTTVSFVPLGILSAAFIVLVKRGDPFSGPARQITLLLSGALYPLSVLPGWLGSLTKFVPATYGVRATRELVQGDAALGDVTFEIVVLLGFAVAAMPVAVLVFRRAVTVARRMGTLATY